MSLITLLVIILLVALVAGWGPIGTYSGGPYLGGGLGLVLVIILILVLLGYIG